MPRVPVIHAALVILALAVMVLPLASQAQAQRGLVTSLSQLEEDRTIRRYRDMYPALSAANLIYSKCSREFDISDSEQEYLKQKFTSVTKGYLSAYQDAYVTATNSPPPQSFLNDVAATLAKRQQDAVDNVAIIIRQKGCNDGRLRQFVKYVASLHKQDRKLQNAQPVEPAKPYQ